MALCKDNLNFMNPDKEEAIKGVMKCSKGRKWAARLLPQLFHYFFDHFKYNKKIHSWCFSIKSVHFKMCGVTEATFWVILESLGANSTSKTSHSFTRVGQTSAFLCQLQMCAETYLIWIFRSDLRLVLFKKPFVPKGLCQSQQEKLLYLLHRRSWIHPKSWLHIMLISIPTALRVNFLLMRN